MLKDIAKFIQKPGNAFCCVPFWVWNSKLDNQERQRQIEILYSMGMGVFFMHARGGMDTPYLSDEWFLKIALCTEAASRSQMEAWLYDEDRWSSGTAGGSVNDVNAEMPKTMNVVDWCRQGFPYYVGNMTPRTSVQ